MYGLEHRLAKLKEDYSYLRSGVLEKGRQADLNRLNEVARDDSVKLIHQVVQEILEKQLAISTKENKIRRFFAGVVPLLEELGSADPLAALEDFYSLKFKEYGLMAENIFDYCGERRPIPNYALVTRTKIVDLFMDAGYVRSEAEELFKVHRKDFGRGKNIGGCTGYKADLANAVVREIAERKKL